MEIFKILCLLLFSCCSSAQQGSPALPVRISSAVIDGTGDSVCPSQSSIDTELNTIKSHIRQAVTTTINPILDQNVSGCSGTGWIRVAVLNMTNPSEVCPSNLTFYSSPVRGCGRRQTAANTCESVFFPLSGRTYSGVCGKILAYQKGATDAFRNSVSVGYDTIESAYVDGVSLTYGSSGRRQHIWTFASAIYEQDPDYNLYPEWTCACTNTQYNWTFQLPTFIENNYFCDTGNSGPGYSLGTYYTDDLLWDGDGCGSFSTCCQYNNPPWFQRTLSRVTSDDIELRLCHGQQSSNEDTLLSLIEIYIR